MATTTTVTTVGDDKIFTIAITSQIAKADNLENDASRFYYGIRWKNDDRFKHEEGGVLVETPYNDLTITQKLSILGYEAHYWLLQGAGAYYKDNAVDTAVKDADVAIHTRY